MELDEFRLVALDSLRKKQVYLFQYLSKLEKNLSVGLTNQARVEDDLIKCVMMTECGCDTLRKLLSKCFVKLYNVGEAKSLFDVFIKLQSNLAQPKLDSKIKMYENDN